jgi:hypothetical protein
MTEQHDIERLRRERAIFSPDRVYRYALTRNSLLLPGPHRYCAFCLLNPSTADERANDATVTRCVGFARNWGFTGIYIVNLFALRATYPSELRTCREPIGPDNDRWLLTVCRNADLVVLGWGNNGDLGNRGRIVIEKLRTAGIVLNCLGCTKTGEPRHPLYLSYKEQLRAVPVREGAFNVRSLLN